MNPRRNQVLHIFRKDVRHFWIEILASLVLLAAYAWHEPASWSGRQFQDLSLLSVLWGFVVPLVPISWCFLIVRIVHDENLVGDRQFWVTRPYDWKQLLAAKALFVAAFISLPLFIVDMILMFKAGFQPTSYMGGLLWMQLLLAVSLVLITGTVVTITASIPQVLLAVLLALLSVIGIVSLVSKVPNSGVPIASSLPEVLPVALVILGCVAVVLLQYSRRRVWRARATVVAMAVMVALILVVIPYGFLIARTYPRLANGQHEPITLSLGPNLPHKKVPDLGSTRLLIIPLHVSGLAEDTVIVARAARFTITAANGMQWASRWRGNGTEFWPDREQASIDFMVPKKFFEQAKTAPSNLHISFGLTVHRAENPKTLQAGEGEFRLSGIGICSPSHPWPNQAVLECRSPLRQSAFIASINTSTITCAPTSDKPPLPPGVWLRSDKLDSSGPAEIGISPIQAWPLFFWNWFDPDDKFASPDICPGTPITLATPVVAQELREEVQFDGLKLEDYAPPEMQLDGSGGVSFFIGHR